VPEGRLDEARRLLAATAAVADMAGIEVEKAVAAEDAEGVEG
jgi:hypothetical protein